ncbi:hypothetical protein ACIG3E_37665 [Streptomyces sp. NPDC053474]|uniref:NACHT N-terminal helical domain 7-containing protein n=1 Tax=Streptomyces sp. NPDC053474 TaxID=3365704 RepID=UPI0037D1F134
MFAASARGLTRFEHSERLAAAHAAVMLCAYCEALSISEVLCKIRELELERGDQVVLAGGEAVGSRRLYALADGLLRANVPMPEAHRPYEETLTMLRDFYRGLSDEVKRYVPGLAVWHAPTPRFWTGRS